MSALFRTDILSSQYNPGRWIEVRRTFRDGSSQDWWALEVITGPYGPTTRERVVIATTDPLTLPDLTTVYLVTNLPAPGSERAADSALAVAGLEEVVRLYGLRRWVEQSSKQVKHTLGWSEYQVRSDQAMRRHWQLVCCAFCFCCYYQAHAPATEPRTAPVQPPPPAEPEPLPLPERQRAEGKKGARSVSTTARVLAQSLTSSQ